MVSDDRDMSKEACYERWIDHRPRRTEIAQQILDGKRDPNPRWPAWMWYDILAEMNRLRKERAEARAAREAELKRRAEKQNEPT